MSNISCNIKKDTEECIICLEPTCKTKKYSPGTDKCKHVICACCIRQYFSNVLKDRRYKDYELIQCPKLACKNFYYSQDILIKFFTKEEIESWWKYAIKSKAYIANKLSCPMEDCPAVFDVDTSEAKKCTFVECHRCHRELCITCQTVWHPDKIKVYDDAEALRKTLSSVEENSWCRRPRCGIIVERIGGCHHIYCICGATFYYDCGKEIRECQDQCFDWIKNCSLC